MRNLLWKFAALSGVTGIGFLVVLQALETLHVEPKLNSQQAQAGQNSAGDTPLRSGPTPALPPLETEERVAFADPPFPKSSAPTRRPVQRPSGNPFAAAQSEPGPSPAQSVEASPDFPLAFPERASADQLPPPPPEPTDLPDLPVLIPASNQTDAPDLEAFSQGQSSPATDPFPAPSGSSPFPAPSASTPSAERAPEAQEDPFADPPALTESKPSENKLPSAPFDPYEPLPAESAKTVESKTDEAPATPPVFPVLPNLTAETNPKAAAIVATGPTESQADPLDLNPPEAGPSFGEVPKPTPTPGRASVQVAGETQGEPTPVFPAASEEFNAKSQPASATEPAPSLALPPMGEPNGDVNAFPDPTLSEGNAPKVALQDAPPQTEPTPALPEAPIDPLDQLNFEEAAPPESTPPSSPPVQPVEFPEVPSDEPKTQAVAPPKIQPRPLNAAPETSSFPSPNFADPNAPPPAAVSDGSPPALDTEGVGVLERTVPSGPQQPELKIEKAAPPKAALGQPMIYHIVVKNVGQSAAHDVIVEDQVPKGTQLTGTIPRGEMAENRLVWRLGVLEPGQEKKIAVRVIPTQEGQIGSVAKVSFVAEVAARTVVAAAKLDLEFTGPPSAVVGDPVTYHFKLSNLGTGDASKVFLRNILPEGLNHPDGNDLEYEVGTLKAGEVKEIDLTVNATKAGEFTNKAILSAAGGAQKEADAKVKILGERLTITRTGPKRRYVGRTASFSNTIANQTDSKIALVRVVEVVPAGMEFVEASAGGQFDPEKRTVTWAIAELGPRQNQLLTLDLVAKEEGPQESEVVAFDPNGTRAVVQSETTVEGYSALRLDVREFADPVDVGEPLALRVVASNKGTKATTMVTVKMTVPEEMEFVSAKGPVDYKREGAAVTFSPIASLAAEQELEFELVLKSIKPGDARVKLEIGSDQMAKPLTREEAVRILATRP